MQKKHLTFNIHSLQTFSLNQEKRGNFLSCSKYIYEKPIANIILRDKRLNAFSKISNKTRISVLTNSIQYYTGGLSQCNEVSRRIKRHEDWKERSKPQDFPGGPVVKNPPCNAGDVGSIPSQGTEIPHATGQLSLCTTTTELERLHQSPCAANYRAHVLWSPHATSREEKTCRTTIEKPARHSERSLMPQQRSCMPQLRPDAAKKK